MPLQQEIRFDAAETRRPWIGRRFGVEMEVRSHRIDRTAYPQRELTDALRHARLTVRQGGYYHSDGTRWDVKTDSSCGFEVATPALTMDRDGHCAELRAGIDAINTVRPRVDRQCGLHVHIDCRDLTWRQMQTLVVLWMRYEPYFFELFPRSRRANHYCPPLRKSEWGGQHGYSWTSMRELMTATNEDAFRRFGRGAPRGALNLSGWWHHGRIEFRLGSGTTDYDKVRNWVLIVLALVDRAKNGPDVQRVIRQPKEHLGFTSRWVFRVIGLVAGGWVQNPPELGEQLLRWADQRRRKFNTMNAEE